MRRRLFYSGRRFLITVPKNEAQAVTAPGESGKDLTLPLAAPLTGFGVFSEKKEDDIQTLVENYTAPALAKALRDREDILHISAQLAANGKYDELHQVLRPFLKFNVDKRRNKQRHDFDPKMPFNYDTLAVVQRYLHRMPRQVFQSNERRASVLIPLCNAHGKPSVLFERRSALVRTHKLEVCFPGGMVDAEDSTIVHTSLREMEEELGIPQETSDVLGVLRCDWSEVSNLTGVAVTPVIGFLGDIESLKVNPNFDEVGEWFTVSIEDLLNDNNWTLREFSAPIFRGGPFPIWGLTGYLLKIFLEDVVKKFNVKGYNTHSANDYAADNVEKHNKL
mmetsp:Transcript_11495/g.18763  ORF Transcript_11495/g.18763 Transcript_11495/m.18763 type:complete len:335 (+) Transcript_11495:33-1037(+)